MLGCFRCSLSIVLCGQGQQCIMQIAYVAHITFFSSQLNVSQLGRLDESSQSTQFSSQKLWALST